MKKIAVLGFLIIGTFYMSCQSDTSNQMKSYGPYKWLKGTEDERWTMVAEQFAGFSHTMMEVQYRYQELYWAGMDENWEYALHHLEHIEEALEAGIQRRPKRSESAMSFMKNEIPYLEKALENGKMSEFLEAFEVVRVGCNACHAKEEVPFISVTTPDVRVTAVRKPTM
jgi:hypothetical protein